MNIKEMGDGLAPKLIQILKEFNITDSFVSYDELKNGNINRTYKVDCSKKSYLVQKINSVAFKNPAELMENIERVTAFLDKNKATPVTMIYYKTSEGKSYFEDGDGFWRVTDYIKSRVFNDGSNIGVVKKVGEAFGAFQTALGGFDAKKLHYTIPDFHNTKKRYADLESAVREDKYNRLCECKTEVEWLLSVKKEACILTDYFENGKLPLRVTHNDTKINNVLFDEKTLEPITVIDLDTVMPGLVGHDFGDAVRAAANLAEEDCDDLTKVGVNLKALEAFADGFLSKTAAFLTDTEIDTLGASCFALTAEVAVRFLTDYLNGDVYFKIKKDRHNLIRARSQSALAKDMLGKADEISSICKSTAEKYRNTSTK